MVPAMLLLMAALAAPSTGTPAVAAAPAVTAPSWSAAGSWPAGGSSSLRWPADRPAGLLAGRPVGRAAPAARSWAASAWGWPLEPEPPVVASFRAPPTPWSAGHRGVDLAAAVGQPVLSAGGGRVTFAGSVAGRGVVVVTHAGGVRTSYEPVGRRRPVGTAVARGDRLGVVAGTPGHCAPGTCLHWGVRVGSRYVDPLELVDRGPPVLLPWR